MKLVLFDFEYVKCGVVCFDMVWGVCVVVELCIFVMIIVMVGYVSVVDFDSV